VFYFARIFFFIFMKSLLHRKKKNALLFTTKILFCNGNLTLALTGWWRRLWARSGCGLSGWAPGWCGWAMASLLRRCCGGAVCWRQAISLPTQSVAVGEVERCVGVRWRTGGGVGVLRTGPVAAGVRVYSSVSHL
jgi:hypothetical protein